MGGNTSVSTPVEVTRTIADKFVTWFNGIEFKTDQEMIVALNEIKDECNVKIDAAP